MGPIHRHVGDHRMLAIAEPEAANTEHLADRRVAAVGGHQQATGDLARPVVRLQAHMGAQRFDARAVQHLPRRADFGDVTQRVEALVAPVQMT